MAKIDLFNSNWCDIVFEDRNKEYGAYELRKGYSRNALLGIVFAIVIFSLGVSAPLVVKLLEGIETVENDFKVTEVTTLEEPPPIDEKQPPPPPVEPPPPLKSTIKFTPPKILPDEEVPDEEPPPTVEEMKEVDAGAKTLEGSADGVDLSLLEGNGNEIIDDAPEQIFLSVEEMPEFPGGEAGLFKYIQENVKYPAIARENQVTGTVYVDFVVDKEGKVTNVKLRRGIGAGCDEEAIRVIKSLPKYKPGRQNGRPQQVQFTVPIRFNLM
jgi:periplasmic protein TonB